MWGDNDVFLAANVPTLHGLQVEIDVAAVDPEYVPPEHCVHALLPLSALNVPTIHAEQLPPLAPEYPALHWQSVISSLPSSELASDGHSEHRPVPGTTLYLPGSHKMQLLLPRITLYEPCGQAVQVLPSNPVYP